MSHDHTHMSGGSKDKRVAIAIWANGILTIAQIGGGIFAGSLALIADALHNFSDMASLVIAYAARKIARRPADAKMTFGYGRIEVVAALINYTSLIIIGFYLVYEGGMRIIDPPEIKGWWVVWLGVVALTVDTLTAVLTYSMQKDSVNIRALFLHNLSDALASVAVIIGGALILLYDLRWVDPAITIGIAVYVLYLGFTEIGGTIRTLMLGSPVDLDVDAVISALSKVDGVIDLHHVHFWQMEEHEASLEAHVVIEQNAWNHFEEIKREIKQLLKQEFNIKHSTLEFEHSDHADIDSQFCEHR
ncbi:cation diffusion facilitator family transporter [Halopseudomonas pelagia]|uniref:Cation transporter n=1 Tax=Halopseudomonas pelagia TaxID=553151 RepID=A0AA91Z7U1_9GAMM|nr:cation diffusion facilitator family transporter [Halopseudomonas pelagia]PCD01464.1 cation transporter [Halopseudomonas pelagia]QFY58527.1 cation transporter [Halopseudomonas pelagia]WOD11692.1 cation diffusion facilitator family transporter [Pseudomonas sp. NyZ704]